MNHHHDEVRGFATLDQSRAAVRLAVVVAGGPAELAQHLQVGVRAVRDWHWRVRVPDKHVREVHALALRAPQFARLGCHKVRMAAVLEGSQLALAAHLGTRNVRVSQWIKGGIVPKRSTLRASLDQRLGELLDHYARALHGDAALSLVPPKRRGLAATRVAAARSGGA